ncbi:hypothetical protein DM860_012643 [Cuscuta australis]|uniref:Phytocyanin domain-containing protein n=1 Tax=Cuscuta australis TaxID=267555 RepID=A0A328DCE2_9ASTE|nr:hypothetical protein DM860_012643 [Cuscuta australis]
MESRIMLLLLLGVTMMMFCEPTAGAVYEVGGAAGWTILGNVDYKAWAASKTFRLGDVLLFKYNKAFHNVVRVTHENFNACNATGGFYTLASGNDSVVITSPRTHLYFICGFPGHCQAGQKVDIRVVDDGCAPTMPAISPVPSPALPPPPPPPPSPVASPPSLAPSPSLAAEAKKSESASLRAFSWVLCLAFFVVAAA